MNNSATTRRISKIAIEYNGNDKGTAECIYSNNLLSTTPEEQFAEMKFIAERNPNVKKWALTINKNSLYSTFSKPGKSKSFIKLRQKATNKTFIPISKGVKA